MNHRRFVRLSLISLASASLAMGQAATGAAKPSSSPGAVSSAHPPAAAPAAPATESNVPTDAPVITLNGVCDVTLNGTAKSSPRPAASAKTGTAGARTSASAGECKTEVTRAEFDQLIKLVNAPASAHRQLAAKYVQMLTLANEAIKLGVDKDPTFGEQLAVTRLNLLAQEAVRKLQTEASNVSDEDAKTYYDQNQSAFEEVTLTRIFIPRTPPPPAAGTQTPANAQPSAGAQAQPSTADAEAIAKGAHDQLAVGGDPEKIQKSAFDQLKNTSAPPSTKVGAKRRNTLPANQEQKVFAMKAGDVSEVFSDTVGYTIYRVDAKQTLPFDQVKDQAKQSVTKQRLADVQQQITSISKADYNDAYFGPETAAATAPRVPQQSAPPAATPVPAPNPPQYPVNSQTPTPVTNQPQRSQPTMPKD